MSTEVESLFEGVAIVGMSGRFPGSRSVREFWSKQCNGVESISHFGIEDLEVRKTAAEALNTNYVPSRSVLENVDLLDAEFFGIYPREAELMDPQHRLFLEVCWEAIEDAGYDQSTYSGAIGVYAGCSMSTYFLAQVCSRPDFIQKFTEGYQVGNYLELMGNSVDFLSTRVSYKLNLRGPSFTMQAGCSTSLLAVSQACQSLLTYQCDMALAGGASISFPQKRGVFYQEGGMVSPDGHCRTFDADAQGTVFGSGVAVVLLKRLDEAIRDGDQIYAVIRGFAVNNDGSSKVGYTAPSVEGQSRVIALAHEAAGVDPGTIGYIEAHGTATPLGDPIELKALAKAFHGRESKTQPCIIGSAKTNVGHLDVAAGVTGLINATHIVRYGVFPPTLHFKSPNTNFDLANSPFRVNTSLSEWKRDAAPRRAGISAFGVGGTNAHVVIEEPPPTTSTASQRPAHLLVLSARSEAAIERATDNLAAHLKETPNLDLGDVAWTLQVGRRTFPWRRTVVAGSLEEAISALSQRDHSRMQTSSRPCDEAPVYFMFPGQGSQYPDMARKIYETEPVFRTAVDRCAEILKPHLKTDIRTMLYPSEDASEEAKRRITDTIFAQPAIFTVEYALAQLWMHWGVCPRAMLGHSVGEFVAACLAGVFSLEDALALVAARGRLMQDIPPGGMLSVRLSESDVRKRMNGLLSLAAVNSPSLCVVAGPFDALASFELQLERDGVACRRLITSHAFHSAMLDPMIEPFMAVVKNVSLQPPQIPYVSGVSGTWITREEATDPFYWARHAREAVQFSAAVTTLQKNEAGAVLLEVGPGTTLSTLARLHANETTIASLPDSSAARDDAKNLMSALGSLWVNGVRPSWPALYNNERRKRISLPTYPFEGKRYWLGASNENAGGAEFPSVDEAPLAECHPEPSSAQEIEVVNKMVTVSNSADTSTVASRTDQIRTALVDILQDLSGIEIAALDSSASFLEMGFDSLFLTQFTVALQNKFGFKVTFRELLGDQSTLDALTQYIDSKLPADFFKSSDQAPAQAMLPSPPSAPATELHTLAPTLPDEMRRASTSPIEQLMHEQMRAMNELFARQLDAARGVTPSSAPPAIVTPIEVLPVTSQATTATASSPAAKEFKAHGPYRPVQKASSSDLTERQKSSLNGLIGRWTSRTSESKRLTQEYRKVLADPRVVSGFRQQWKEMVYPIITERSQGSRIWDVDGNEYIDIVNGFGPIMLGHRPDFVENAIAKQLSEGFETGPQSPLAGKVAQLFCEMTGNERMTFCNTGSEAVLAALRVARTVTGRNKVVSFAGDYHGLFDEVLVKGIRNKAGEPQAAPVAPGIPRESVANMVVLDYGEAESLEWIRKNAKDLAAVLVEPVQSRHPDLQPIEFLKELRDITQKSGTALVFDEVVTGFRVHAGGCQALFGIRADLATYGKVVAGGMPIGILAGKSEYMDALDGGTWRFGDDSYPEVGVTFFAGTFVRHPLAVAATLAVLEHLQKQGPSLQEALTERTQYLVRVLKETAAAHRIQVRIENFGSIFYVSFPTEERFSSLFYYYMRDRGVHIREGFPCFLTTAHTDSDVAKIVQAFEDSIVEMVEADLLTAGTSAAIEPQANPSAPASRQASMTESQLEVWLSDQLCKEASCSYNESFTVHMRGVVNEGALRTAIQQVLGRHDALRASFDGEKIVQNFAERSNLEIPTIDLSGLSTSERAGQLREIVDQEAQIPFSVGEGPLVRVKLLKIEDKYQQLLFTAHHIVCDGWSTNVLLDEIAQTYNAAVRGAKCELAPAMSFATYAEAQAAFSRSPEGEKVEQYWLDQYKDPAPLLDLPVDRPRPAVKEFNGATYRKTIGAEAYTRFKKVGASQKCTLFATLLAGFQILLGRLSGQDDIVIGVPTAGQSLLDDATLVGHCVNFIPFRGRLKSDLKAAEFLAQMKSTVLAGYEHQNYTYGRLVRKLAFQRDPSRLPLTEIQFNLERVASGLTLDGCEVEFEPNPKSFVNFDIFLNIRESKDGLALDCDYNSGLFNEDTIARWLDCYEVLLEGIAANVNERVSQLPLLTDAERKFLLNDCNGPNKVTQAEEAMHQIFEMRVQESPKAIAVEFEDKRLTYAELDARANQLARYLRRNGVKPGVLVGVFVERSLDMIVALIAVLKSGGAYVPLDPTFPPARLSHILEDANAPVVLTQAAFTEKWSFGNAQVIRLDSDRFAIAREDTAKPDDNTARDDLAYVIYTSGSTGNPKGVEVRHRSLTNLLRAMQENPGLDKTDVLAAVTTLSFDIAGLELFLPLCVGAKLVIVGRETASYGVQLIDYLKKVDATVMQATPVTWKQLIEAGWSGTPALKVLCGGEEFPRDLANELVKRSSSVWNLYGPTETTIWSAAYKVTAGEGPVPIGHPIANTRFYVLDKNLQLAPLGAAGELCIGGEGLARGYLNRAELTTEKFVADPFSDEPVGRLYRTGDLVRRRGDGTLEFLGRIDDQIKLRGFRIELGEIQSVLASHPDIKDSVVLLREDTPGEKRLVAYYVATAGSAPTAIGLRDFALKKLPDYMAPAAYISLPSLPLTPNGKIDRRALPAPDWSQRSKSTSYEPPSGGDQEGLAQIFAQVLRIKQVGINDNIFELGADSLHVFQIAARAVKAGISVTPRQILQHRTIAAITANKSNELQTKPSASVIRPVPRQKFRVTAGTVQ